MKPFYQPLGSGRIHNTPWQLVELPSQWSRQCLDRRSPLGQLTLRLAVVQRSQSNANWSVAVHAECSLEEASIPTELRKDLEAEPNREGFKVDSAARRPRNWAFQCVLNGGGYSPRWLKARSVRLVADFWMCSKQPTTWQPRLRRETKPHKAVDGSCLVNMGE